MHSFTAWPPSEATLSRAVTDETDLIEHKAKWPDLTQGHGKATLAKHVLAMANAARPDQPGVILFGVTDKRHGGGIVGVVEPPAPETVVNVLNSYIMPPPDARSGVARLGDHVLGVLTVAWSPARPHYPVREYPGVLAVGSTLVRRDKTVGILTIPELEAMIREKDARLGPPTYQPLQAGFIGTGTWDSSRSLTARVANLSAEPLSGVEVVIDVAQQRAPTRVYRTRRLTNATLQPGEGREIDLRYSDVTFYDEGSDSTGQRVMNHIRDSDFIGDRWLDVTLHAYYRDHDGFIQEVRSVLALEW